MGMRLTCAMKVDSIRIFPILHTQRGVTALYNASANGHSEVVKLLVQAGADLELQREVY